MTDMVEDDWMPKTMLGKVAFAICTGYLTGDSPSNWREYVPEAREILTVMREPDEAMINAAAETPGMKAADSAMQIHQARGHSFADGSFDAGSPLHQAWRAMINSALTEENANG